MQHLLTPQFIDVVQEDAKVAATKTKRPKKPLTEEQKAAAKKKAQERVLRNLVVDTGKSPSKKGTERGGSSPAKKPRLD